MFLTSNEQASGYPVKSLTSKLAGALRTTKAQLVLQDLISFMTLAGVKRSKGNFTTDPFNELRLQLLIAPPGSSARIIIVFCLAHVLIQMRLGHDAGYRTQSRCCS